LAPQVAGDDLEAVDTKNNAILRSAKAQVSTGLSEVLSEETIDLDDFEEALEETSNDVADEMLSDGSSKVSLTSNESAISSKLSSLRALSE
jgi:hypothetical protein